MEKASDVVTDGTKNPVQSALWASECDPDRVNPEADELNPRLLLPSNAVIYPIVVAVVAQAGHGPGHKCVCALCLDCVTESECACSLSLLLALSLALASVLKYTYALEL